MTITVPEPLLDAPPEVLVAPPQLEPVPELAVAVGEVAVPLDAPLVLALTVAEDAMLALLAELVVDDDAVDVERELAPEPVTPVLPTELAVLAMLVPVDPVVLADVVETPVRGEPQADTATSPAKIAADRNAMGPPNFRDHRGKESCCRVPVGAVDR